MNKTSTKKKHVFPVYFFDLTVLTNMQISDPDCKFFSIYQAST